MGKIDLPNVTLCAASDVALEGTVRAMERCIENVKFKDALLFSSKTPPADVDRSIRHIPIAPLRSRMDYSRFILADLAKHIETEFALITQWDGFIINASAWRDEFLSFDYIGAPWLDYTPETNVGNGGFSLRSKALLGAGSQSWFEIAHPEDLCICHRNRPALQERGFRIADLETARRFAREREPHRVTHFGIHGVFSIAETFAPADFQRFLEMIEPGIIGKRELRDLLRILKADRLHNAKAIKRCVAELLRTDPFHWKTLAAIANLATPTKKSLLR